VNTNTSITHGSAVSAKSANNRSGVESQGLYQPKFTKKSIEKGEAQPFMQKARRMSSHEFVGGVAAQECGGADAGFYMKNPSMIATQAYKATVSSSITH